MKKTILLVLLSAFSFTAFSQSVSLGIKGGLNISNLNYDVDGVSVYQSSLKTFNAGVFADFKFGNISLQPALNFTGKGGEDHIEISDSKGTPAGTSVSKITLYYLQLPVNIVYHVPVVIGDVYFGVGPYIAKGLSGTAKYPTNDDSGKATTVSEPVNFGIDTGLKSTETGVDAIAGLKFKNGFLVNINYDLGLTNISPVAGVSIKTHVLGISIGYCFL